MASKPRKLFISHASRDDTLVRALQQGLAECGQQVWIDSRELRGGDPLWDTIRQAIEDADVLAVLVSPDGLQSKWLGKELKHALELQRQRGQDRFAVIPLTLDDTRLGVLEGYFDEEPTYISLRSGAGGVDAALDAILVALRLKLPSDPEPVPQPSAAPLEELVLELSDLGLQQDPDGKRRASARARLVHERADPAQPDVRSSQRWPFVAPIGPIEANELRWYLEQYAVWPSRVFAPRAEKVEADLQHWGRLLHRQALADPAAANVMQSWARVPAKSSRRFSVYVDAEPGAVRLPAFAEAETDVGDAPADAVREAATQLLGLPWELLHDGQSFLFQGAQPVRVRRRLPNTEALDVPVLTPPIRVLLVSARPEDAACGYIDHRASALPLVEATEHLGGLLRLQVLGQATLGALRQELDRARAAGKPYHVLHFDGHGVYDRRSGLGGLCFEHPDDADSLAHRRHVTVTTSELGPLLRHHRIPLVFLEACQTATAEQASESVASELLKVGIAAVVAMSHSVLVATATRFVKAFYAGLAAGQRIGDAMLVGQRELKDNPGRGRIFGLGELQLQDWFVPVLFQEKADPQLFCQVPAPQTRQITLERLAARAGDLPPPPAPAFVGRSRELLALERLLRDSRYAVLRGQGGEGKTALAAEFARWMLRSHQVQRVAFVSLETHGHLRAVIDALGRQLVGKQYSVAAYSDLQQAVQPIERALREQPTLLVLDNLESLLLPPWLAAQSAPALIDDAARELADVLALAARLNAVAETRLLFTSREALPAPFDGVRSLRELHRLDRGDAVKLVERTLDAAGAAAQGDAAADARIEAIEALVDAVQGHARTLALLAPALRERGVDATRESLVALMVEMERRFPGSREKSLFASVALSLRRLSAENQQRVRVLGLFHGAVDLDVLRMMMEWHDAEVAALAQDCVATGLATADPYNHLTLNPALCPYLRAQLSDAELQDWTPRWVEAMRAYTGFLNRQQSQQAEVAATLTRLGLANLFALLDAVQQAGDAAATIGLATSLYGLLQALGKPRLVERVGQVRDAAAAQLGSAASHAAFDASRTKIEQQLAAGRLREALDGAGALLASARLAGEQAYPGADFDLAIGCWLLGRVLKTAGGAAQALPLLGEARQRFEAVTQARQSMAAERMASAALTEIGDCLLDLGRLDEAAQAYEAGIRLDTSRGSERDVAVGQGQLGTVRLQQRRYPDALQAYAEARERFTRLGEPGGVATSWHQTGIVCQASGQAEAAELAYRQSLAIKVQINDMAGQAGSLSQLGTLYGDVIDRPEEAVAFYRQSADRYVAIGDLAKEGRSRNNLAGTLRKLKRLAEAGQEIRRAIECDEPFGHAAEPWKTWAILADIETDSGHPAKAAQALAQARAAYLAYRRDGGENQDPDGKIANDLRQRLLAGDQTGAADFVRQLAAVPDPPAWLPPFVAALQAIVAGSRDPALADAPGMRYDTAAELLLLIETLSQPR